MSIITSGDLSLYLKPIVGDDFPFVISAAASGSEIKSVSFYYQLDSVFDADLNLIKKPGPRQRIGKADSPVPGESNLYQVLWEENKEYFISGKYNIFAILKNKDGKLHNSNMRYLEVR